MALDQAYLAIQTGPRWWVRSYGIYRHRLFVTFRNGDCAYYTMPEPQALATLARLRASPHPGAFVNYQLYRGDAQYQKYADPTSNILHGGAGNTCLTAVRILNPILYVRRFTAADIEQWFIFNWADAATLSLTLDAVDHSGGGFGTNFTVDLFFCASPSGGPNPCLNITSLGQISQAAPNQTFPSGTFTAPATLAMSLAFFGPNVDFTLTITIP